MRDKRGIVFSRPCLRLSALGVLVCLLFGAPVFGQGGKASVTGLVTDGSGASIAEAAVTITSPETGFSQTATSNSTGNYSLLFLPVGGYKITAQRPGFKSEVRTGVTLTADQAATIDFQLTVGQVSEQVSVSADAQLLETENAALGQVINERAIEELPLNGRNPASLVLLTTGTVDILQTGAGVKQSYTTFPTETGASANGGRQGSTYYLLDGAINMDNYHLLAAPFPNPDATQEFRVVGNNFDARYGFAPGAVVSIVTKSGTNEWHGNAFEFLRNGDLNARDFFYAGRDELKRNQFGGSLGGPIVKNKLFIFGNYQGTTERRNVAGTTAFVPSDAMLSGDFSALLKNGIQLVDPVNKQDFANNYINPARFSPGALTVLKSIPRTTDPLGQVTVTGFVSQQDYNEFTIRGDYNINERHHLSVRTFVNRFSQPPQSKSLLNSDRSWDSNWQNYAVNYTWTINPNIVNNIVGAYTKLNSTSVSGLRDSTGKPICYSQFIDVADPPNSPCSIEELGVGSSFGFGQNFNGINRSTWNVAESINITKGKHLIVAGVDVLKQYWNLGTDWLALPIIDFDGSYTGHELSDFMLGYVSGYTQGGGEYQQLHATQLGAYVQDQIKVTPNFTVNVGLRWEPFLAPEAASGRIAVWAPGQQSQRYPNAPNGIIYPGDPGVSSAGMPSSYNYFAPRLGLAWRPGFMKNTSIRAAFGMFTAPVDYSSWNHSADTSPFSPTFSLSHTDPAVGAISFDHPWANYAPTGFKSPFPPFPSPGTSPDSSAAFVTPLAFQAGWNQDFRLGRNQTWNVSIEHQFLNNWLLRGAYVGSEAYHLVVPIEKNPGVYSLAGARIYQDFSTVSEMDSWGTSSYQSGQFTLERRFANGLQFTANYTLSKSLDTASLGSLAFASSVRDPLNLRNNRGLSDFDRTHVFNANFVYQTPGLASHGVLARQVFGNWQLSGIFRAQSGGPLTVVSGRDNSLTHTGDLADLVPGQQVWTQHGSTQDWLNEYFNTSAYAPNALGTKGNSGRNTLRGPGFSSWDAGLSKTWAVRERYRLQFRWEAFNLFNHTSFGNPNVNDSSSNFGRILAVGPVPPRVMQGALKFSF